MISKKYRNIINHYETCLKRYGDNHLGVDWPKKEDVATRYQVMLDLMSHYGVIKNESFSMLDFGCGAGHFLEFLIEKKNSWIKYSGLDASEKYINLCKKKFPSFSFYHVDILEKDLEKDFDFIILNGVFTEKIDLTFNEMFEYFKLVLTKVFKHTKIGVAFNVMSKHVDWERDDLFHLPFDMLANFLILNLSRNFIIRNDYGLYEYTTYIYK